MYGTVELLTRTINTPNQSHEVFGVFVTVYVKQFVDVYIYVHTDRTLDSLGFVHVHV